MKPIWIVDDDPSIRFVLEKALARENLPTRSFTNPREVLEALADVDASDAARQPPQVLVSDIRMPGGSGLQLLEQVRTQQPGLPVIIMTAYSDLDSAVSAFQRGAFEYLAKPFDLPKAVELIRRAVEESQREEIIEDQTPLNAEMLGQAPAMQDVFRAIGRLSQSQVTVLITGDNPDPDAVLAGYLSELSTLYRAFVAAAGDPVASGLFTTVTDLCGTLGAQVRVELPGGDDLVGTATALDTSGRLIVRDQANDELQAVAAGDVSLDARVAQEACPLNLAPTSSTTATLVLGDALAIALLEARGFTAEDFAFSHPGGALGRRLLLKVENVMHSGDELPQVVRGTLLKEALMEMTHKGLGMTVVIEKDGRLAGIFTDGDLRRTLDREIDIRNATIDAVMTPHGKTARADMLAAEALKIMEDHKISALVVVDKQDRPVGALNMHDLLRAGVM